MEPPREETETGIASKLARGTFSAIWRRWRRFFREGDEMAASFDKLIQEIGSRYCIGPKACPLVQEALGLIIGAVSSIGSRPPVSPSRLLLG
jgi:hypothetical protein